MTNHVTVENVTFENAISTDNTLYTIRQEMRLAYRLISTSKNLTSKEKLKIFTSKKCY